MLFTPLEKTADGKYKLESLNNITDLVEIYNNNLYSSPKQQMRKMVVKYDHIFIESYKDDTVSIINTLKSIYS